MAWIGAQFSREDEYILQLGQEDICEVEAALDQFKGMPPPPILAQPNM